MTEVTPSVAMSADFTEYLARHAEHLRRLEECRLANIAALFDALAAASIANVVVTFDGYGDSGQVESIDARDAKGDVALPEATVDIGSPGEGETTEHVAMLIREVIEELAYDLLRDTHAGWENNDGAYGDFTFDVAARRSASITANATRRSNPTVTNGEEGDMGHCYHHALSSVRKWGGVPEDYLALHQWFDEPSKLILADFRHRALRHHAEGIFQLESQFGVTITLSTGRVVPVRLIGEQHVREDLGFIPSFADWVRCIRPEPWMGRAQPIHREVDPFAVAAVALTAVNDGTSAIGRTGGIDDHRVAAAR